MRWAVDAAGMRDIDAYAIQTLGIPGWLLMENAGRAVADEAPHLMSGQNMRTVVLCGPGNNGGDGLVAARLLLQRGWSVVAYLFCAASKLQGDAARNLSRAHEVGVPIREVKSKEDVKELIDSLDGVPFVIDALLGTGTRGAPRGIVGDAVTALVHTEKPVLSVDIPTGLDSDTGQTPGDCLRARTTVTMGLAKTGMYFPPGCHTVGRLVVADIGFPRELIVSPAGAVEIAEGADIPSMLPAVSSTAHKGDCGRVVVVAGSTGMTGAAALACRAAVRVGAGLVYLAIPESLNSIAETLLPEVITVPVPEIDGAHCREGFGRIHDYLETAEVLLLGPGIGRSKATGELVHRLLESWRGPTILDADGLYHTSPDMMFHPRLLLTPHLGEMARLTGKEVRELLNDRLSEAKSEALRRNATLLMKGIPTVIVSSDARIALNITGNAGLASGGSGDVLAGIAAGLLAQQAETFRAAQAAAFLHGRAADLLALSMPHAAIVPSDLLTVLPETLRSVGCGDRSNPVPWWQSADE